MTMPVANQPAQLRAAEAAQVFDFCGTLRVRSRGFIGPIEGGWRRWQVDAILRGSYDVLEPLQAVYGGRLEPMRGANNGRWMLLGSGMHPLLRAIWPHVRLTKPLLTLYSDFRAASQGVRGRPPEGLDGDQLSDRAERYRASIESRNEIARAIGAEAARLQAARPYLPRRGKVVVGGVREAAPVEDVPEEVLNLEAELRAVQVRLAAARARMARVDVGSSRTATSSSSDVTTAATPPA